MGLWLKCPECQAANALDLKACTACNASLENLPVAQRVYVIGMAAPAAPPPEAAAVEAAPSPAAAPPPAAPEPKAAPAPAPLEVIASTAPPAKKGKGPKSVKKKK